MLLAHLGKARLCHASFKNIYCVGSTLVTSVPVHVFETDKMLCGASSPASLPTPPCINNSQVI